MIKDLTAATPVSMESFQNVVGKYTSRSSDANVETAL